MIKQRAEIKHEIITGGGKLPEMKTSWGKILGNIEDQNDLVVFIDEKVDDLKSDIDSNYATKSEIPTKTSELKNDSHFLTRHQDLSEYAKLTDIPKPIDAYTKIESDNKYQTKGNYVTDDKLSDYAKKTDIPKPIDAYTKTESDNKYQVKGDYAKKSEIPTIPSFKTINGEVITGEGNIEIKGGSGVTSYNDLTDKPFIPTKTSDITNDSGFLTEHQSLEGYAKVSDVPTKTSDITNDSGFLTEHQSLEGYAKVSDIPTDVSAFNNDAGYLTKHQSLDGYAKLTDLPEVPTDVSAFNNDAGYLTKHQSLEGYAKVSDVPTKTSELTNDSGFLTEHQSLDGYYHEGENIILNIGQFITGETGNMEHPWNHGIELGGVGRDKLDFYEWGGEFVFHKRQHWADTVIARITENGIEENGEMLSDKYAKKSDLDDLKLYKFPNATIFGNPTINDGQVSGFNDTNYLQFPFLVDFNNRPFEINMCFTTGSSLGRQNNIIDSNYGLAIAIREMKFVVALSSNGTSWNLDEHVGSMNVTTDTTYYVKFSWDGTQYKLSVSQDKVNYSDDIIYQSSETLYPKQIKIGTSYFGAYPFTGSINLNYCNLIISSHEVWQGMDDVGLTTRLATDLSNIDSEGERKIKDIVGWIPSLDDYYTKEEIDSKIGDIEDILKTI